MAGELLFRCVYPGRYVDVMNRLTPLLATCRVDQEARALLDLAAIAYRSRQPRLGSEQMFRIPLTIHTDRQTQGSLTISTTRQVVEFIVEQLCFDAGARYSLSEPGLGSSFVVIENSYSVLDGLATFRLLFRYEQAGLQELTYSCDECSVYIVPRPILLALRAELVSELSFCSVASGTNAPALALAELNAFSSLLDRVAEDPTLTLALNSLL